MSKRHHKAKPRPTKSPLNPTRYIKVKRGLYMTPLKSHPNCPGRPTPLIQLKGHWLHQAGFEIETPVTVKVSHHRIILTPSKPLTH